MLSENMSSRDHISVAQHFFPKENFWATDKFSPSENESKEENLSEIVDENDTKIYKTRLLLTLWDLVGENPAEIGVKKSELTGKVKHKKQGQKIGKYQKIYQELEEEGAIIIENRDRTILVFITDKGEQMLGEGLKNPNFGFEGPVVPARLANVLLRWIRFCTASNDSSWE